MPKGPGDDVAVTFVVADAVVDVSLGSAEDIRYVATYARLFSDAEDQGVRDESKRLFLVESSFDEMLGVQNMHKDTPNHSLAYG